jgi:hypothetical protein
MQAQVLNVSKNFASILIPVETSCIPVFVKELDPLSFTAQRMDRLFG